MICITTIGILLNCTTDCVKETGILCNFQRYRKLLAMLLQVTETGIDFSVFYNVTGSYFKCFCDTLDGKLGMFV